MIDGKTLEQVISAQQHLQSARRIMETLVDIELKSSEWAPGHGEKPHRLRNLETLVRIADESITTLDELWS